MINSRTPIQEVQVRNDRYQWAGRLLKVGVAYDLLRFLLVLFGAGMTAYSMCFLLLVCNRSKMTCRGQRRLSYVSAEASNDCWQTGALSMPDRIDVDTSFETPRRQLGTPSDQCPPDILKARQIALNAPAAK